MRSAKTIPTCEEETLPRARLAVKKKNVKQNNARHEDDFDRRGRDSSYEETRREKEYETVQKPRRLRPPRKRLAVNNLDDSGLQGRDSPRNKEADSDL